MSCKGKTNSKEKHKGRELCVLLVQNKGREQWKEGNRIKEESSVRGKYTCTNRKRKKKKDNSEQ